MISTFSTKIAGLFVQGKLNHFPPGIDGLHDDTCAKELGSVRAVGARLRSYFTSLSSSCSVIVVIRVGVPIIAININIIKVLDKVRSHKLEDVLAGLEV